MKNKKSVQPWRHRESTGTTDELIARVLEVIRRRYPEPQLRLGDVADELHVQPQKISQRLATVTGYGFPATINLLRLEKGASLLITTDLPISKVAVAVGYASCRSFDRHFTPRFGVSPRAFRLNKSASSRLK